jgi:hypothetical protein
MGKSIISMAMFNSKLFVYQRVNAIFGTPFFTYLRVILGVHVVQIIPYPDRSR